MFANKDESNKGKWYQFGAAFIAGFIGITDGIAVAWTSPMIPYFLSENTHIKMSRNETEWLETCLLLGATCGLPLTAYSVEKFGRKRSLIFSCSFLILTWISIALGDHVAYLIAARFFQGIGLNMAFVAAPMYVGEVSHKSIRGFLSSIIFVMSMLGMIIVYAVGPFLPFYASSVISIVVLVIEVVVFSFLPESPYFCITNGQFAEATASLRKFRGGADVEEEINQITKAIEDDKKQAAVGHEVRGRFLYDLVKIKNYRKALLIMFILNCGQLFCSFEVILMNLHEILEEAGSAYIETSYVAIIFASINFLSSVTSSIIVDRFGRKALLLLSVTLTGTCLLLLALYFHFQYLGFDTLIYSWIPTVTVMAYAAVFRIGLGMVPIVVTSEIFASKIKAFGMTFADGVYVVSSVLALQVFFAMRNSIGMFAAFYTFFCCSILMLICIIFIVPETKGKTLEEVQDILKK